MSLFRNENPNLGPASTINEAATATSVSFTTTSTKDHKVVSRIFVDVPLAASGATGSQYIFMASVPVQVIGVRINCTAASGGASALSVERIIGDTVAPAAANGTTIILQTAATIALAGLTPNTKTSAALSVASGSPTVLNVGDQLALFWSAATTSLAGCLVQVELKQI